MSIKSIFNNLFKTKTDTIINIDTGVSNEKTTYQEKVVYQGRWGYHPVSYETFLKLKELHKWYYMTLYALARWVRWNRKTVYRHGAEPQYCGIFVLDKWSCRTSIDKNGNTRCHWWPKTIVDYGIRESYQLARMPKKTAEEVQQLEISEHLINRLHSQVSKFFKTV